MVTYEEVKDIPNHPDRYLIDVRSRDEIEETGSLPASLNIPLPELEKALDSPPEDFKKTYGRNKPLEDTVIIFSCKAGGRAQRAEKAAKSKGYTNAKAYVGSWTEWEQKQRKK